MDDDSLKFGTAVPARVERDGDAHAVAVESTDAPALEVPADLEKTEDAGWRPLCRYR